MKNLIKSIIYELLKSKLLLFIYLAMVALMIALGLLNSSDFNCASGIYVKDASMTYIFPLFVIAVVVGIVICPDYKDKVANYELLSGHSRISVFLSRMICAIIPGAFMAYLLTFLPMISGTIASGWGDKLSFSDVLLRQILFIFPFIRIATFMACLAFIVKNEYVLMAAGAVLSFGSLVLISLFQDVNTNVFVGVYNLNYLMSYDKWSIYNISPTEGVVEYISAKGSIDSKMIAGTIIVSCVMTLVYMVIGYALFRKSEMN